MIYHIHWSTQHVRRRRLKAHFVKSSLNQLPGDCTEDQSLRPGKEVCFCFRIFVLSVFIKIYALSLKYLGGALPNFYQLTAAQSHVHRPCVCRVYRLWAKMGGWHVKWPTWAAVSISRRIFLWAHGLCSVFAISRPAHISR